MHRRISIIFLIAVIIVIFCGFSSDGKETDEKSQLYLVGIEYFNGWWPRSPDNDIHCFWETNNQDWRTKYPGRIPLLGEYSCQATMDEEILTASKYGVDFFSILWYFMKDKESERVMDSLNAGVEYFMKSSNSGRMKFMVELANHEPNSIITDEDWDECIDLFVRAMRHPSYLRIDGKAVLKIHSGDKFLKDNDQSVQRSKQILNHLRQRVKDEGAGEVLVTLGNYSSKPIDSHHVYSLLREIDCTMQYNSLPDKVRIDSDYPYEDLTDEAKRIRNIRKEDTLNWVPYLPAGWNPKPWNDQRASYSLPTRKQWRTALEELKTDILKYPNFGFPKRDGTTQKAFTIYAWNEFGEGGIVAPTNGEKYMKLEEIKNIFED